MRDIKKCYKRLKMNEDVVKHGDMINFWGSTGFYLNGYSLHYRKSFSEIGLNKKNIHKAGNKAWSKSLFRRVKP